MLLTVFDKKYLRDEEQKFFFCSSSLKHFKIFFIIVGDVYVYYVYFIPLSLSALAYSAA